MEVERECAFPSTSGASLGIWYVDSRASRHMTGVHEYFSELSESGTDIEVVLGDLELLNTPYHSLTCPNTLACLGIT